MHTYIGRRTGDVGVWRQSPWFRKGRRVCGHGLVDGGSPRRVEMDHKIGWLTSTWRRIIGAKTLIVTLDTYLGCHRDRNIGRYRILNNSKYFLICFQCFFSQTADGGTRRPRRKHQPSLGLPNEAHFAQLGVFDSFFDQLKIHLNVSPSGFAININTA